MCGIGYEFRTVSFAYISFKRIFNSPKCMVVVHIALSVAKSQHSVKAAQDRCEPVAFALSPKAGASLKTEKRR